MEKKTFYTFNKLNQKIKFLGLVTYQWFMAFGSVMLVLTLLGFIAFFLVLTGWIGYATISAKRSKRGQTEFFHALVVRSQVQSHYTDQNQILKFL